jgi:hypothetical protein
MVLKEIQEDKVLLALLDLLVLLVLQEFKVQKAQ